MQEQDVAKEGMLPYRKHFNFVDAYCTVRFPLSEVQLGLFVNVAFSSHADHVEIYKDHCQHLNISAHPQALSRDNSSNSLTK